MSEPVIRLESLSLGYRWPRKRLVLESLDLVANRGEVTAIVGPNGVGKTTFFRALLGFLAPWAGTITIEGESPSVHRRRTGISYLPEVVALPPGYRLGEFLRLGACLAKLDESEIEAAVTSGLHDVDLASSSGSLLRTFSKGMGRRAALAFALLGNPSVLLLDEPLSGLDARARVLLRELIVGVSQRGLTVVMASHDLAEVARTADVVYVLDRGRIKRRLEKCDIVHSDLERLVLDGDRLQ